MSLKQQIKKRARETKPKPIRGAVATALYELGEEAVRDLDDAIRAGISARIIAESITELGHPVNKGQVAHYIERRRPLLQEEDNE